MYDKLRVTVLFVSFLHRVSDRMMQSQKRALLMLGYILLNVLETQTVS